MWASGRREGHPQLNALMAAARNREIDCVLVWKFDRFARSTSAIPSFFVTARTALASSVNGLRLLHGRLINQPGENKLPLPSASDRENNPIQYFADEIEVTAKATNP
jgi:hypothetical protein